MYHLRTFQDFLYDAVYLLYFAHDTNQEKYPDDVIRPFVRSSIINSAFMLECAANCLIDSLGLPKRFYKDIDRLPCISKYEYYLRNINPNRVFDRGCSEVQNIDAFLSIRNAYVHPKVHRQAYDISDDTSCRTVSFGVNELGFSKNPCFWRKEDAKKTLKLTNDFFNTFFLVWCEFQPKIVVDLLLSHEKVEINNPIGAFVDCVGGLDRAVTDWGIDFKFLGKK